MGILNRTPDSFFDQGRYFDFDGFLAKAEQLVAEGADLLDVGGVKAGPGPEVTAEEELERVDPRHRGAAGPLRRAALGRHVAGVGARARRWRAGAVVGNDISGFADPDYLPVAAAAGASVVATHIRIGPARPRSRARVRRAGRRRRAPASSAPAAEAAEAAGIPRERVMVDAGLDLGKTEPQSLELLRAPRPAGRARLAAVPVGVEQAVPRRPRRHRRWTTAARRATPPTPSGIALGQPDPPRPRRARRPAHRRRDGRRARRPRRGERMTRHDRSTIPITLLKGDDEVVLRDAVRLLVDDLVGDEDRVADGRGGRGRRAGRRRRSAARASSTPPRRRRSSPTSGSSSGASPRSASAASSCSRSSTTSQDPLPSTRLVLEWRGGKVPKALTEAVAQVGGAVVDTSPGRKVGEWVAEHLSEAGLKVDNEGRARLVTWVGDEPSRLLGLIDLLRSTYGPGAKITAAEIEPFLGDDGGVPPWDLTDAIDRGDRAVALELLQRMIGQGDRHPFQVLSTLHSHFARMLRLDGADVAGEKEAAELLGLKGSTFPAKKALGPDPPARPRARRAGHRPPRRGRPRPARRQGLARPPRARGARGPPGHDVRE